MPANRSLNSAGERVRMALNQRVVDLVDAAGSEGSLQDRVRALAFGDHHQPGRTDVQPLHDAPPLRNPGGRDPEAGPGKVAEYVGSGPAQTGMGSDTDRLVDHHDVLVVVHDDNAFDLLRSYSRHSRLIVKLHFEHGPNTDAIRLRN